MKHLKMLTFGAAIAVLLVVSAPASATQLTSPSGAVYTGSVHAESGKLTWSGSFVTIECAKSTWSGNVVSHGSSITTGISLSSLSFTECNFAFTVNKTGSFEIHTDSATSDGNGTLTSTGAEITSKTSVGTCIFTTNATDLGTVKGGTPATVEIKGAKIPRTGGSAGFLCGSTATLNGTYTITTPSTLLVD